MNMFKVGDRVKVISSGCNGECYYCPNPGDDGIITKMSVVGLNADLWINDARSYYMVSCEHLTLIKVGRSKITPLPLPG